MQPYRGLPWAHTPSKARRRKTASHLQNSKSRPPCRDISNLLTRNGSHFLKLPAELRRKIYNYVCGGYHLKIYSESHVKGPYISARGLEDGPGGTWFLPPYSWYHGDQLQLALTNRQMRQEVLHAFYSTASVETFTFMAFQHLLRLFPNEYLALIPKLIIRVDVTGSQEDLDLGVHLLSAGVLGRMQRLKELEISLRTQNVAPNRDTSLEASYALSQSVMLPRLRKGEISLWGDKVGSHARAKLINIAKARKFAKVLQGILTESGVLEHR